MSKTRIYCPNQLIAGVIGARMQVTGVPASVIGSHVLTEIQPSEAREWLLENDFDVKKLRLDIRLA